MLNAAVASLQERDEEPEDDGEEELRDGGLPCNVNRGGFPVDEETWDRMWRHVAKIHPNREDLEKEIRGATDLPKVTELTDVELLLPVIQHIRGHRDAIHIDLNEHVTLNHKYSTMF